MVAVQRTRIVNPRLGAYFGIFISAFIAIALMALIFEGLGLASETLRMCMLAAPIALYAAIGMAGYTQEPLEFFAAGRRVPAFYNGLAMSACATGATGLVAGTGAFFLIGFDALSLAIGVLAGFVVMAVMLAPFLRKFGAFTIPTYLGRRLESRTLRVFAAMVLAVPMLLIIAAELRMGAFAASWLTGQSPTLMIWLLAASIVLIVGAGGMRSLTWTSVAQGLASLIALCVPTAIVGIMLTNMPVAQLSHGPVLRAIGRNEAIQGMPIVIPPSLAFDIPGIGLTEIAKRFADAFGSVGEGAFVIATLTIAAGIASAPWLLPRVATTPGVYEARKSIGWATVLFGIVMLTTASIGVFMRDFVMDLVISTGPAVVPSWLQALADRGLATIAEVGTKFQITSFSFSRDSILFALPMAAGMPEMVLSLALAGAVAAALAGAAASVVALGNILAEDVVSGLSWEPVSGPSRQHIGRLSIAMAAGFGTAIAMAASSDPLELLLWALALTASTSFPILILSILSKRLNAIGALAGMLTGFSVSVITILASEAQWIDLDGALSAVFGLPSATIVTLLVSAITPAPSRHALELVRDIRVPGGEILYDREMRLLRQRKLKRG